MISEFSITNFRSIRDKVVFSLQGESGQLKAENTFEVSLPNEQNRKLLKSAVIYGANASGKSNFIRALFTLVNFIRTSTNFSVDEPIPFYEPFLFDTRKEQAPTEFVLDFLLPENNIFVKYQYRLIFNREEILSEELDYFPKGQSHNLFKRNNDKSDGSEAIHTGRLGKSLGYREISVFRNQLLFSKFGKDVPHELLSDVYLYFNTVEVWNALNVSRIGQLREQIAEELFLPENAKLLQRLNKLIQIADTKIQSINVREREKSDMDLDPINLARITPKMRRQSEQILAQHNLYNGNELVGTKSLPLSQESAGTSVLFALGGIIIKRLERGGVLFVDELDNSLHPKLSKFLVRLFNNPISNPRNAQLVVATHEVTLLDKEVFRKDQIWFAEKNEYGVTEIFSVKDFEGVRDDTPFDKWYMNGKFGGQPKIKEIEFIFGHE